MSSFEVEYEPVFQFVVDNVRPTNTRAVSEGELVASSSFWVPVKPIFRKLFMGFYGITKVF